MTSGWTSTTIGDQIPLQRGYDITKLNQRSGTVPVISSGGVSSYHDTAKARGPGVVIGRKSNSIGRSYYVQENYWPHDTTLWVTDFRGNDPKFVYYFFLNLYPRLVQLDVGSANPTLNRNHIHPMRVDWPSVAEQRAIGEILGSLDDKIDLNRRMNETLEAIARAIFRSWFVDFDPVRAKAEGRPPHGMDEETAGLFPDSFEDSTLGKIPFGWRVMQVGQVCEFNRRQIQGTSALETIDYVDISSVMRGRLIEIQRLRYAEAPSRARRLVTQGDTIFSTVRPGRGAFLYIYEPSDQMVVSTGFAVMTPMGVPSAFLYEWVTSNDFIEFMDRNADGAAYPAIRPERIGQGLILVPPQPILKKFEDLCQPCLAKMASNERESRTLAALRDALLPKLLSGEIRVKEAESLVQ